MCWAAIAVYFSKRIPKTTIMFGGNYLLQIYYFHPYVIWLQATANETSPDSLVEESAVAPRKDAVGSVRSIAVTEEQEVQSFLRGCFDSSPPAVIRWDMGGSILGFTAEKMPKRADKIINLIPKRIPSLLS